MASADLSCNRSRRRGGGRKCCERKAFNGVCAQIYLRIANPSYTTFVNTVFTKVLLPITVGELICKGGLLIYRRDDVILRSLKAPTPINASVFIFLYPM